MPLKDVEKIHCDAQITMLSWVWDLGAAGVGRL